MDYAVLLEYIRAMLGVATPGSGDPKPIAQVPWYHSLIFLFNSTQIFLFMKSHYSDIPIHYRM